MVLDSPEAQIIDRGSFFFQYFNQSRRREWGKEGEGGVLLSGVGGGAGCIGGISKFHVGWQ